MSDLVLKLRFDLFILIEKYNYLICNDNNDAWGYNQCLSNNVYIGLPVIRQFMGDVTL